jgi:hypothetical protein
VHYNFIIFVRGETIARIKWNKQPLSMRDSATSAMRGWEHWKPDGFASELFLDQLIVLEI